MEKISDIFGSMVFNDAVMRERLPKETYRQVQATMEKGRLAKSKNKDIMPRIMLDKAYSLFTSSMCLLSIAVPQ